MTSKADKKVIHGYWGRNLIIVINCLLIFFVLAASIAAAEETVLTGFVNHVRDGDTIEVSKIPIRLNGVSAPEIKEPYGPEAKKFMKKLVQSKKVRCVLNGETTYDRFVGICFFNGKDIGISILESGFAVDCPRYSNGRYAKYEVAGVKSKIKLPKYCK